MTFGKSDMLEVSNDQDFTSILQVGEKLFSIAHFESPQPAATYLVELDQDKDTGDLSVVRSVHFKFFHRCFLLQYLQ